eukprot:CAMPEP_0185290822 /NCGR_PEP_ID=MMETSP1363-20130426/4889_1 /TAXON_ID=38817 /ORGANISM="Gephyrocapsa oceanica, Strain RCC1303" /LENGTH=193 /DNA_ID=CAMNT_0027886877 /DNA_START=158 /DNA_END=741 /DNA_ORIENTATION=-
MAEKRAEARGSEAAPARNTSHDHDPSFRRERREQGSPRPRPHRVCGGQLRTVARVDSSLCRCGGSAGRGSAAWLPHCAFRPTGERVPAAPAEESALTSGESADPGRGSPRRGALRRDMRRAGGAAPTAGEGRESREPPAGRLEVGPKLDEARALFGEPVPVAPLREKGDVEARSRPLFAKPPHGLVPDHSVAL